MSQLTGQEMLELLKAQAKSNQIMCIHVLDLVQALGTLIRGREKIALSPDGLRLLVKILAGQEIENLPYDVVSMEMTVQELSRIIRAAFFSRDGRNKEEIHCADLNLYPTGAELLALFQEVEQACS